VQHVKGDEQAYSFARAAQEGVQSGIIDRVQFLYGLELHDDQIIDRHVDPERRLHPHPGVYHRHLDQPPHIVFRSHQLVGQARLVARFQQPGPSAVCTFIAAPITSSETTRWISMESP